MTTVIHALAAEGRPPDGNVGLFGGSLGAAVALQASAEDPRVGAVVSEAGGEERVRRVREFFLANSG